jgi:hypothetical protein
MDEEYQDIKYDYKNNYLQVFKQVIEITGIIGN